MGKSYDLGKKSDMRRFQRDLEKVVKETALQGIQTMTFDYTCPSCGREIQVKVGKNVCPYCLQSLVVENKINF